MSDPFDRFLDDGLPEQTDNGPRPEDGDQPDQNPGGPRTDLVEGD